MPAAVSGGRLLGVPMSRDGNRPRSWANPTLIQEETDWVASCRGMRTDQAENERIAKLRGPYSDFIPTAPIAAFEVHGVTSAADEPVDPWATSDPWRGSSLPKGPMEHSGDAWKGYRGLAAGRAAGSGDPYGSTHSWGGAPVRSAGPQPRDGRGEGRSWDRPHGQRWRTRWRWRT